MQRRSFSILQEQAQAVFGSVSPAFSRAKRLGRDVTFFPEFLRDVVAAKPRHRGISGMKTPGLFDAVARMMRAEGCIMRDTAGCHMLRARLDRGP